LYVRNKKLDQNNDSTNLTLYDINKKLLEISHLAEILRWYCKADKVTKRPKKNLKFEYKQLKNDAIKWSVVFCYFGLKSIKTVTKPNNESFVIGS
jgi:hypothetical protein